VREIARVCAARGLGAVRVGTVDEFQGQQASAVIFSLTSSSAEDTPRGMGFVLNANRVNVALSRAQALAIVVGSPRLLDAPCRTLEQVALVSTVCRFIERARASGPRSGDAGSRLRRVAAGVCCEAATPPSDAGIRPQTPWTDPTIVRSNGRTR
jgi:hypothetical protein